MPDRAPLVSPPNYARKNQLHMELINVGLVHTDTTLGMLSTAVVSASSALIFLKPLNMQDKMSAHYRASLACAVDEDLVKGMVDLLVSSGLKKAGYEYFVIDGEPLTFELWLADNHVGCPLHIDPL